jgi:hypothetical protein
MLINCSIELIGFGELPRRKEREKEEKVRRNVLR